MANAVKNTKTQTVVTGITLHLNPREALALQTVLSNIGGEQVTLDLK